jgi:hypothetical protein
MSLEEHPTVKRYREKAGSRMDAAAGKLDALGLKEMTRESGAVALDGAVVVRLPPRLTYGEGAWKPMLQ